MKNLVFIGLLLLTIRLSAQDSAYYRHDLLVKEAEKCKKGQDFEKSLAFYNDAIKQIDFCFHDYVDAFRVSVNMSDYKKANDYLINATLKGFDISVISYPEIDSFNMNTYGREYWRKKDSLQQIYLRSIDTEYCKELSEMYKLDQSVRSSIKEKHIREQFNDSIIFERLIGLAKEKGFPTYKTVGRELNIVEILLVHNMEFYPNSNQWKRIAPYVQKEVFSGNLSPNFLSEIEQVFIGWNLDKR